MKKYEKGVVCNKIIIIFTPEFEKEMDRHRKGYYEEYAKRTGRKDRHRQGYYRDYNRAHPERLERVGVCGTVIGSPCLHCNEVFKKVKRQTV